MRVLVADDESGVRGFLHVMLSTRGHAVHSVATGSLLRQVLTAARDSYDVALVDLTMPEWSGYDDAVQVNRDYKIPVVVLTGGSKTIPREPAIPIVYKPFDSAELMSALERVWSCEN
jgi:CheY-like chemotaxis protein